MGDIVPPEAERIHWLERILFGKTSNDIDTSDPTPWRFFFLWICNWRPLAGGSVIVAGLGVWATQEAKVIPWFIGSAVVVALASASASAWKVFVDERRRVQNLVRRANDAEEQIRRLNKSHGVANNENRSKLNKHRMAIMVTQMQNLVKELDDIGLNTDEVSWPANEESDVDHYLQSGGDLSRSLPFLRKRVRNLGYDWDPEEEWAIHTGQHAEWQRQALVKQVAIAANEIASKAAQDSKKPLITLSIIECNVGIALPDTGEAFTKLTTLVDPTRINNPEGHILVGFLRVLLRNDGAITDIEDYCIEIRRDGKWVTVRNDLPNDYRPLVAHEDATRFFDQWKGSQIGSPERVQQHLWFWFFAYPAPFMPVGDEWNINIDPWLEPLDSEWRLSVTTNYGNTEQIHFRFEDKKRWAPATRDPIMCCETNLYNPVQIGDSTSQNGGIIKA